MASKFAQSIGADTLEKLRAMTSQQTLDAASKDKNAFRFGPNIDGYFFPESPAEIYAKGEEAHVTLLAGWNRDEGNYHTFFGTDPATKENYEKKVAQMFGEKAPDVLKAFPGDTDKQVKSFSRPASYGELHRVWHVEVDRDAGEIGRCRRLPV